MNSSRNITNEPLEKTVTGQETEVYSMDEKLVRKLNEVVLANLKNEQFSVEDLAGEVAFSRSHLHRKLNQLTGQSISQFIRSIRLDQALELLKNEVGTVSEIAYQVGFGSNTYFIKCFHDQYGYSPGEVKKRVYNKGTDSPLEKESPESTAIPSKPIVTPLESLHPTASTSMIMEIFDEMVKHKTSLQKFLLEEDEESPDIRLLAYQIIKNFPWPIAVELRRLFSVSMKEPGKSRRDQLDKTIKRIVKIITFLLICEIIKQVQKKQIHLPDEFKSGFKQRSIDFNPQNMLWSFRQTQEIIHHQNPALVIEELKHLYDPDFIRELDDWMELSTEVDLDITTQCELLEQTLISLLKKTAFLVKYKLVNVGEINVKKTRFKIPMFRHRFHLLNSPDAEFKVHEEALKEFSDSHAILMMKSIKEVNDFLNLSPFIIDTHASKHTEKNTFKQDIFLLESASENLVYSGTEVRETTTLSYLENYQEIIEEYGELVDLITKK